MTPTRDQILETVSNNLLSVPPLVFRAVHKRLASTLSEADMSITPHHFEILRLLEEEGTMHVSEIGERLRIARAQMTKLIDRLVTLGMVERTVHPSDRRTYDIRLSVTSKAVMAEKNRRALQAVQEIVSSLSDADLETVSGSLRNLRDILTKISSPDQERQNNSAEDR
jgi:DNA-binding MarR family transcriptional regulator